MKNIFTINKTLPSYSLKHGDDARMTKVRTKSIGVELITYPGNKLWRHLVQEIKQSSNFPIFKNKLDVGMVQNATVCSAKYIS